VESINSVTATVHEVTVNNGNYLGLLLSDIILRPTQCC